MPRVKKNRHPQKSPLQLISRVIHGLGAADTGPVPQRTGRTTEEGGHAGQESRDRTPGLSRSGQAEPRRRGGDAGQESRERTEGRSQLPRIRWVPHTLPAALTPKDTCSGD